MGFARTTLVLAVLVTMGVTALVIAQETTVSRQATSVQNGTGTASASSSAAARAGSSSSRSTGGQLGSATIGGFDPNKRLYAAWYTDNRRTRGNQKEDIAFSQHVNYMKGLSMDGTCIADGPFGDGTGLLAVIQAPDDESAFRLIHNDPSVTDGDYSAVVKQWTVVQGRWVGGDTIGRPTPARNNGIGGGSAAAGG